MASWTSAEARNQPTVAGGDVAEEATHFAGGQQTASGATASVNQKRVNDTSTVAVLASRGAPVEPPSYDAREASRALTRHRWNESERAAVFQAFGMLAEKELLSDGQLTRAERAQLAKLRWQIDNITDADLGDSLDVYEYVTSVHEQIADELKDLIAALRERGVEPRQHGKQRRR